MQMNHFCALASACDSNTISYHITMVIMQAYASVQLNADLGLSDYVYGLGSGIFFLGYMLFQVCTVFNPVRIFQAFHEISSATCVLYSGILSASGSPCASHISVMTLIHSRCLLAVLCPPCAMEHA